MTGFSAVPVADDPEDAHDRRWAGVARVVGPAWSRLPSLTIGFFGVQMLWSVEMSYASPYLLSLGLSKSLMAIVFLAGPLSGLIVQPLIGILADNSKSRFGRRRPFIVVCAALCALATLLLGFTRPFATVFTTLNSVANNVLTIWLAVASIYCIDFCINAVQALDRALLVDILPTAKQPAGNAWAARMLAVGSVAGFFVGNLDLPHIFPFLGGVQLQVLSLIAAFLLFSTQAWVCLRVKERVLLRSSSSPKGLRQELKVLWDTLLGLPSVIRQICWIQFLWAFLFCSLLPALMVPSAALGWFPVLFYATVYIGDLHKRSLPIPENEDAAIALDEESTRLGSRALFYSALVSLAANIIMPFFVISQHAGHAPGPHQPKRKTWLERVRMHLASLWAFSHFIFAMCMAATFVASTVSGATWIISVTGFCWAITQWAPFALLGEAILSHPAPGDAGSIHLADTRSTHVFRTRDDVEHHHSVDEEETRQLFRPDVDDDDDEGNSDGEGEDDGKGKHHHRHHRHQDDEPDPRTRIVGLGNARARISRVDIAHSHPLPLSPTHSEEQENAMSAMSTTAMSAPGSSATKTPVEGLSAQAGAIIGIHNMFVVVPQFLVTGFASIIFAIFDPDKSALHDHPQVGHTQAGDTARRLVAARAGDASLSSSQPDAMAIIFRFGGVAAAIAFVLCYRLARDLQRPRS